MSVPLLTIQIRYEHDVVLARQKARTIAEFLCFDRQDQVRIATTISELARNIFQYASQGKIVFSFVDKTNSLQILCSDKGKGISNLKEILEGRYVSKTGMGLGILGAKKLTDRLEIETGPNGTTIYLDKIAPLPVLLSPKTLDELSRKLVDSGEDPFVEIQRQNQELLSTMDELQKRQTELDQLNKELEDTNRGVVALYAELDEKADYLRRASEVKTRFLSNMTHEFRTPLNSILGLSRMLLDRTDGELSVDQEKQVSFIKRAATDLSELVNDLLDISKVEAGKITVRPTSFEVEDLFSALRGMLRPLLAANSSINLIFEEPPENIAPIFTDESKLSQILRNFISNSLKYTDQGEVRVRAALQPDGTLLFSVTDTGMGVAPGDMDRIFEEFTQIEGPHQKKIKGTGLGLPLSKKLAELLGGTVFVKSKEGQGSTFSVCLPVSFHGETELTAAPHLTKVMDPSKIPVLVIDDNSETLFIYENYLKGTRFQAVTARSTREARQILNRLTPHAIILDILLDHENSWHFITELKNQERTRPIPLFVVTMVENEGKALDLGADGFHLKPIDKTWLNTTLESIKDPTAPAKILIVDDDQVSRYLFRSVLQDSVYEVMEAAGGHDGLQTALEKSPDLIFLDMAMPDLDGIEFLKKSQKILKLQKIPVIIYSSKPPASETLAKLNVPIAGILIKDHSTREKSRSEILNVIETVLGSEETISK